MHEPHHSYEELVAELEALRAEINQLRQSNDALNQLAEAMQTETALKKMKDDMEMRVIERTIELIGVNRQLQAELDERTQVEEALRISQARFAGILEIASDAIISVDGEQKITLFNQGAEKIFGYAAQDVIGQSLDLLLPSRFAADHRRFVVDFGGAVQRARKMGERREIYGRRQDGTEFPAEASISKLELGSDRVYTVILRDVSERRRAEHALQQSEEWFRLLVEGVEDYAMFVLDANGYIASWNVGAERIHQYRAEEIIGRHFTRFYVPDDIAQQKPDAALEQAAIASRFEEEGWRVRQDGSRFWANVLITALRNEAGELRGFSTVVRDITERKRTKEALEHLSQQNELILNSVGEGLCGLDLQGNITFVNPAAAKLLGYQVGELTGKSIRLLLPRTKPDGTPYPFQDSPVYAALQNGTVYQVTNEVFHRHDGTPFPVEYISTPIWLQRSIIGAVVTFRDITERRVIERMKDEFVSVVSHELRTPLTSIHGSLGMLASGLLKPESAKGQRLLQIAVESTDRLVRLINDILDIERIESGKVSMVKEICDVADLVDEAVNVVQAIADKAEVTLSISSVSVPIWADPDRIIQTLTNLLSNAIKFSPQGSTVRLSTEVSDTTRQTAAAALAEVIFRVEDHGRGIPTDKLDSIFERFQQVDASDSRNNEGTGLGLAICRSIVQQHAGRIGVESTLGQGSTFSFALPIFQPDTPAISPLPSAHPLPPAPLVMVCDDDGSIRQVLQNLLESKGYRVITVASGPEAIAQAIAQHPNVILLDLVMPEMNGWEVIAALKETPSTQDIPIVICSVCSPSQSNYPSEGFINWVGKPLDEVSLLQSLRQALAKPPQQLTVLVVEDDLNLAQVLIALFERHDIQTFHAQTGREAIRLSQEVQPDLLVLDLILPDGDGFAVVEWLQQHNTLFSIPLVVYSAKDLSETEQDELKLGQTEFLTKGRVTTQEFEQRVMQLLQRMTQQRLKQGFSAD